MLNDLLRSLDIVRNDDDMLDIMKHWHNTFYDGRTRDKEPTTPTSVIKHRKKRKLKKKASTLSRRKNR